MSHRSRRQKKLRKDPKKEAPVPNGTPNLVDLDKIFCVAAKKYKLESLWLKAVAIIESSLNIRAYRYEPAFFDRYLKDNPEWKDRDPKIVSASFGACQIMFTTAWAAGLRTQPDEAMVEDLYNPMINIELGAKLLRTILDKVASNEHQRLDIKYMLHPYAIANARFNGGITANPDAVGELRNREYARKVFDLWLRLTQEEKECDDQT